MSADVTEDPAAAPKKKKKGLGSFFKVTTDKAAGPPLQQDQAMFMRRILLFTCRLRVEYVNNTYSMCKQHVA